MIILSFSFSFSSYLFLFSASAWRLLGQLHALNDDDDKALLALNESNYYMPHQQETLMALAISYANNTNREKTVLFVFNHFF